MSSLTQDLVEAARTYSSCANTVRHKAASPTHLTIVESEQLIGFGIASEWLRSAAAMTGVTYRRRIAGSSIRRSKKREPGITELIRFNMSWYAMNAVFSRKPILALLGTPRSNSEADKFRLIVTCAGLSTSRVAQTTNDLHTVLNFRHVTRMPNQSTGMSVTALQAIYEKYTPQDFQTLGVGRDVKHALAAGTLAGLDLATLIYLMRNWIIHASMMDGAFGSMVRFRQYTDTISEALASIHAGVSRALHARL